MYYSLKVRYRIIDLNERTKPIKFFQENIGINTCDAGKDKGFLNIPKAKMIKEKIN